MYSDFGVAGVAGPKVYPFFATFFSFLLISFFYLFSSIITKSVLIDAAYSPDSADII